MSKSVYEFWISTNDNKDRLRLPVNPSSIDISSGSKNESIDISNLGEITVLQDPASKVFQFSSFLPLHASPLVEYSNHPKPWDAVNKLEKWKNSKEPLRFLVTGTSINIPVSIEIFNYQEEGGAVGDIRFDLSLKEYKFVTVRKIKVKINKPTTKKSRPAVTPKGKTHKVVRGDTLWGISRKYYKDNGLGWKKIWNLKSNKDMLIKRDSRNRKNPGHWIYPGQVLRIP
ncbi:LysM peptidoglycan-binding domain-containing protein [Oceanobacillus sp. CF4.6]|uniref:LysM peptidoglycan-binding domain-containing protein n=1 Tax=Oceanobacillus sp. CF4.6 TaxID=3373080 RepID=UPI003EE5584C